MTETVVVREWKRPRPLTPKHLDPNFTYRYARKDWVKRRLEENNGWEVDMGNGNFSTEAGNIDKATHYRGLILMRLPKDIAAQRNKFYTDIHHRRLRAAATGAGISAASADANREVAGALTSVSGKSTIQTVVSNAQGSHTVENKTFDMGDVAPEDIQALARIKEAQQKELERRKSAGGQETEKNKPPVKKKRR